MTLQEKTVLVVGGGTGMGRATALAFARLGCRVAVSGRREGPLRETAAQHDGAPPIVFKTCDVADLAEVEALVAWADGELGRIDIFVNSAGTNVARRSMAETTPADWEELVAINATGAYYCLHAILPQMRARRDGLVFNISSVAGKRPIPIGGLAYNASKAAMGALGMSIGYEEGDNGIRVTNIVPGETDTPILEKRPQPVTDEHRARMLTGDDVAAMIVAIAQLPPHAHVPELIIKPVTQPYA